MGPAPPRWRGGRTLLTMKVFVSSVIAGFEAYREAAASSASTLDHEVLRSEDFGAVDVSSQVACLSAVRAADVTLVVIGARYGQVQESGLSATHEEFREACETGRVLVFEQQGIEMEPQQVELLREARDWAGGVGTAPFESPADLERAVTQALHRLERRDLTGSVDLDEIHGRAVSEVASAGSRMVSLLHLVVAGGPRQAILRPSEFTSELLSHLKSEALTGVNAVLDTRIGTAESLNADSITLMQETGASIKLDSFGTIGVATPALVGSDDALSRQAVSIVQEHVEASLERSATLAAGILDRIDPTQRLSDLCVAAALSGASYLGWSQNSAQSNVVTASILSRPDPLVVPGEPRHVPRPGLRADRDRIVRDLVALLRAAFGS
jgi:hypothetical protein